RSWIVGLLLIFKVTVPFQKLNLVSLTQAGVLPVSPFDSRMPPFQGVGGGVNTRVHQVVEHVRQRVVDQGEGALQIKVGFALHRQRQDEGPVDRKSTRLNSS